MVQRVLVLVVAALAIAWLGVSYGNAREIRRAQIVAADPHATPAAIESALREARVGAHARPEPHRVALLRGRARDPGRPAR